MKRNIFFWVKLIFTTIGLVFLTASFIIKISSGKFYRSAEKTNATIVGIESHKEYNLRRSRYEKHHDVYINYYTKNGEYLQDISLGYYSGKMYEGQSIQVYYDPENPTDVRFKSGSGFIFFTFLGIGCVFTALGIGLTICTRKL